MFTKLSIHSKTLLNSINKITVKQLFLALMLMLNLPYGYSQKPVVGIDICSTGNGHGASYSPYFGINKNKNTFQIGPVIQHSSMLMRGAKITYSRKLTIDTSFKSQNGEKELLQLNFFSALQYTDKLCFSDKTLTEEKLIWKDQRPGLENLKLSTAELNVGFELYLNITNQLSWKNYFGASVYYNFNYTEVLEHQQCAPTLNLGTGLCFFL